MEETNWKTLIPTLIGGLNTMAMAAGLYHLDNDMLEAVIGVVSSFAMLVGIVLTHKKKTPTFM